MAYDESVAERLRTTFAGKSGVTEKKMFGGIAFMLGGNMCCGVIGSELMARVGPDQHEAALARPHARIMDFTGRPMKGYVYVAPEGFENEKDLRGWVEMCERFVGTLPVK
jgi:hypothetical protein